MITGTASADSRRTRRISRRRGGSPVMGWLVKNGAERVLVGKSNYLIAFRGVDWAAYGTLQEDCRRGSAGAEHVTFGSPQLSPENYWRSAFRKISQICLSLTQRRKCLCPHMQWKALARQIHQLVKWLLFMGVMPIFRWAGLMMGHSGLAVQKR